MQLGAFSLSLAVKDLAASRRFYEGLGFHTLGGESGQDWVILKNGSTVIGLFQGLFDQNMLTFNPGWDASAAPVDPFTDIREIQSRLKTQGYVFDVEAESEGSGPASFVIRDPDGNPVLFDQHR